MTQTGARGLQQYGWLVLGVCLGSFARVEPAQAQLERRDHRLGPGLTLTTLGGYPRLTSTGHTTIHMGVVARNEGPERTVTLSSTHSPNWERSLRVPRGGSVRQFVHVPIRAFEHAGALQLRLRDGASGAQKLAFVDDGTTYSGKEVIGRLGELHTPMNVAEPWAFVGAIDAHLPDDWRALAGIRVIVTELGTLTQRAEWRPLLAQWVNAGGILILLAPVEALDTLPEPWLEGPFAAPPEARGYGRRQRMGFGAVLLSAPDVVYEVGADFLGRVELGDLSGFHGEDPHQHNFDEDASALRKRLPGLGGVPTWTLFTVQLVFALLVGPLGYRHFIARRRQPFRYVTFAVGISALFSVGMLAADLTDTGLRPVVNGESVVLVDQRSGFEIGAADTAVYAPTRLGTELLAPAASELIVQTTQIDPGAQSVLAQHQDEQRWQRGVLPRTLELFGNRWLGEARGRLVVAPDGEGVRVENHFGETLRELELWHGGKRYVAAELGAGAHTTLHAADSDVSVTRLSPGGVLPSGLDSLWTRIAAGELGTQRYRARRDQPPREAARTDGATTLRGTQRHLIAGLL